MVSLVLPDHFVAHIVIIDIITRNCHKLMAWFAPLAAGALGGVAASAADAAFEAVDSFVDDVADSAVHAAGEVASDIWSGLTGTSGGASSSNVPSQSWHSPHTRLYRKKKYKRNYPRRKRMSSDRPKKRRRASRTRVSTRAGRRPYTKSRAMVFRSPVPKRLPLKFRWVETVAFSTGGVSSTAGFHANSLYAPDITSAVHKPLGFDQYMAMYGRFTVLRSKISVNYISASGSAVPLVAVLQLDRDNSVGTTGYKNEIENRHCTYRVMHGLRNAAPSSCVLSKTFSATRDLGVRSPLSETDCSGTDSANPTRLRYFHVSLYTVDGSTNIPADCHAVIQIEYDAILHGVKDLASS